MLLAVSDIIGPDVGGFTVFCHLMRHAKLPCSDWLTGSLYGPNVRRWMQTTSGDSVNLGQCFIAIDPECFAPGFQGRMSDLLGYLRGMEPSDPEKPVQVPGDPERRHMKSVDEQGGISYHQNQLKASVELAERLEIRPMATK
uniref:Uncharacterized protein n=1 Tax=Timema bartmani TaxID=61472 RepID=A0A7R9EWA5_9NEOP|nr:unnamed protein product [Timema bartmani]